MIRASVAREKTRRLLHVVELLERSLPVDPAPLATDEDLLHLVAFRVYLGLQEAIDLASHVIADEGWGPVASLREHFDVLAARGVVAPATAGLLADAVKIRNLIAHAYGDVDPVKLHAGARALPTPLRDLCASVLRLVEQAEGP